MEKFNSKNEILHIQQDKPTVVLQVPLEQMADVGVFPEELWLYILDKLEKSEDILNVLKAFPDLARSFKNNKASWLFDQVLPQLMTKHLVIQKSFGDGEEHVNSRELLKLRLVSKRWKRIVESSVQNHPDFHPINSKNSQQLSASGDVPVNHFNYTRINKYHLGATVFKTHKQIDDFQNEMSNFRQNPFPGRFVVFMPHHDSDSLMFVPEDPFQVFVKKAMQLLQIFGKHILYLVIAIGDDGECHLNLCKDILGGLSSVPNLQSLKLLGNLSGPPEATQVFFGKPESLVLFPKLENLESFQWEVTLNSRSTWVEHMISLYSGHSGGKQTALRKLALDHKYWNAEMTANLAHLTELHLLLDQDKNYEVEQIRNVLRMFPNGQLKKFCLKDYPDINQDRKIYIDELIGMLGEFQIESVEFEMLLLKEKGSKLEAVGITSLHLDDCFGISYDFLEQLPNLQYLSVHMDPIVFSQVERPSLSRNIRRYFFQALKEGKWKIDYRYDIWEKYANLKILTASFIEHGKLWDVQFVREHGRKPFFGWNGGEEDEIHGSLEEVDDSISEDEL